MTYLSMILIGDDLPKISFKSQHHNLKQKVNS
jgi:hypothetical protein